MGASGSKGFQDAVASVSPWNTQVQIDNQSTTPVLVWLARDPEHPNADDAVEHEVPPQSIYAISSGWLREPRATLLMRTDVNTAKIIRMPNASRLIVSLQPHGLKVESLDDVVFEDYPDPGAVQGHDTIPMVLRHESFHDRPPAAEMPRDSVAREAARDVTISAPKIEEPQTNQGDTS